MNRPRPAVLRVKTRTGGVTLEFALILPVFVAMVVGVADISWLSWQRTAMEVAVAEGCRAGSLLDVGVGSVDLDAVLDATAARIYARVEGMGVECGDCDVAVSLEELSGLQVLDCAMVRTCAPITGFMPDVLAQAETLARMEVQR